MSVCKNGVKQVPKHVCKCGGHGKENIGENRDIDDAYAPESEPMSGRAFDQPDFINDSKLEVHQAIRNLEETIDRINKTSNEVIDRLDPILSRVVEDGKDAYPIQAHQTPLANCIQNLDCKLESTLLILNAILNRIQI